VSCKIISVPVCAQKLPLKPPIINNPTKANANNNSVVKNVVLFNNEAIHPQTFIDAGNAINTVITKNKILALLSKPTKYI
jgi:hypothetical protein